MRSRSSVGWPSATPACAKISVVFRVGVNLVMHALTGNYKDDMVHLPDIMQRLRR